MLSRMRGVWIECKTMKIQNEWNVDTEYEKVYSLQLPQVVIKEYRRCSSSKVTRPAIASTNTARKSVEVCRADNVPCLRAIPTGDAV
jgi:hypothetical protein